jgi:hypothetical protein
MARVECRLIPALLSPSTRERRPWDISTERVAPSQVYDRVGSSTAMIAMVPSGVVAGILFTDTITTSLQGGTASSRPVTSMAVLMIDPRPDRHADPTDRHASHPVPRFDRPRSAFHRPSLFLVAGPA